jgi:hypothetical protein
MELRGGGKSSNREAPVLPGARRVDRAATSSIVPAVVVGTAGSCDGGRNPPVPKTETVGCAALCIASILAD